MKHKANKARMNDCNINLDCRNFYVRKILPNKFVNGNIKFKS